MVVADDQAFHNGVSPPPLSSISLVPPFFSSTSSLRLSPPEMAVVGARTRLLLSLLLLSAVLLTHTSAQLLAPAQRIFQREDQSGTFLQAVERCQAGGGALVSIRSLEEQAQANAIRRLLSPTATLWYVQTQSHGREGREKKTVLTRGKSRRRLFRKKPAK